MTVGLDMSPLSGFDPYSNPSLRTDPRMAPGGIVEGLGNLASALITTPQKVAQIKMQQLQIQNEMEYRRGMLSARFAGLQTPEDRMALAKAKQDAADARAKAEQGAAAARQQANIAAAQARQEAQQGFQRQREIDKAKDAANSPQGRPMTTGQAYSKADELARWQVGDPDLKQGVGPDGQPKLVPRTDAERMQVLPQYQAALARNLRNFGVNPDTMQRMPMQSGGASAPVGQMAPQGPSAQQQPPTGPAGVMPPQPMQPAARAPIQGQQPPSASPGPWSVVNGRPYGDGAVSAFHDALSQAHPDDQVRYNRILASGDPQRIQLAQQRIWSAFGPRSSDQPMGPDSTLAGGLPNRTPAIGATLLSPDAQPNRSAPAPAIPPAPPTSQGNIPLLGNPGNIPPLGQVTTP